MLWHHLQFLVVFKEWFVQIKAKFLSNVSYMWLLAGSHIRWQSVFVFFLSLQVCVSLLSVGQYSNKTMKYTFSLKSPKFNSWTEKKRGFEMTQQLRKTMNIFRKSDLRSYFFMLNWNFSNSRLKINNAMLFFFYCWLNSSNHRYKGRTSGNTVFLFSYPENKQPLFELSLTLFQTVISKAALFSPSFVTQ